MPWQRVSDKVNKKYNKITVKNDTGNAFTESI